MRLELESGGLSKTPIVSTGRRGYRFRRKPHRFERASERVLVVLALNGPSTAYNLAWGCRFGGSTVKKTLFSLRQKGLVSVTARVVEIDRTTTRTRSEAWGLSPQGIHDVLPLIQDYDWALNRMGQNYPLQIVLSRPSRRDSGRTPGPAGDDHRPKRQLHQCNLSSAPGEAQLRNGRVHHRAHAHR